MSNKAICQKETVRGVFCVHRCQDSRNRSCGSSDIDGIIIVIVVKVDDPVQLRIDDIYDHSFVSTIQHHVHHISNNREASLALITFSPDSVNGEVLSKNV
jgi:hypothetical protein